MDDGTGRTVCASICAAIHNAQQRAKHSHLQNIYNNPDTRSMVCCSCDGNYCVRISFVIRIVCDNFIHRFRFHHMTMLHQVVNAT